VGSSSIAACSSPESADLAASSRVITSESVVHLARPFLPGNATILASSSTVFTRLPLWPNAIPDPTSVIANVGWAFSQVVEPVVEYRQWPTAM